MANLPAFPGFYEPQSNYSKLPHQLINALVEINSIAELKVVLYILRHTWGFRDTHKRITLDEFMHGRKRKDGTRIDNGTGLSVNSVRKGIAEAEAHGFIVIDTDETDKARWKTAYSLRTIEGEADYQNLIIDNVTRLSEFDTRTEKETLLERNLSTPATAGVERNGSKTMRSEHVVEFPVKGLTAKILANEKAKRVVPMKPRDLYWELVLEQSYGITYDPANPPSKTIAGRVSGCVADLKAHGYTLETMKAFYADYPNWRPKMSVTRERGALVSDVALWQKERATTPAGVVTIKRLGDE